jgi:phosphatidylinositol-3-phosphatase
MRPRTGRSGFRRRTAITLMAAGLLVTQATAVSASNGRSWKNFDHVFVIMMENTGYAALIGNPNAPWINSAAQTYGFALSSYGVTHPSQPNYVAITAGTTAGVPDDNDVTISALNIVDQLEAKGKTWTDYQESISLCAGNLLAHACGNQLYERKHNPFVSFADVQTNPTRMANVVDLSQLGTDLASGSVADYSFIAPNQCNDMHGRGGGGAADPCDYSNVQGLIATGDAFLGNLVGQIMSSSAWSANSVIFVTWDESDYTGSPTDFGFGDTSGCCTANPGGGHVVTLVISSTHDGARQSDRAYNHYSVLGTIQDAWGLGCLAATCEKSRVHRMTDLVNPRS